ncbi:hypothetical protein D3C87_1131680 [compost metagenome]
MVLLAVPVRHRGGHHRSLRHHLLHHHAALAPADRGAIPARRREPGLPGRERHRRADAEGGGGRAPDAEPLGASLGRLRQGRLQGGQAEYLGRTGHSVGQQDIHGPHPLCRRQAGHRRGSDRGRAGRLQHAGGTSGGACAASGGSVAAVPGGAGRRRSSGRRAERADGGAVFGDALGPAADQGRHRL